MNPTALDSSATAEHPARLTEAPKWLVFSIVSLGLFMSAIDATVVATALPSLSRALHAPIDWTSWSLIAYTLGLAVSMPVAGRLSDQLGRRRVFLVAAAVFTVASLLCGLAVNIAMLIVLRFVQGIGGGAFVPSASGLIVEAFGGHRTRALGMMSGIFPLGALVGPIIGAFILTPLGEILLAATKAAGIEYPGIELVFHGILLVAIIRALPGGVWPWLLRRFGPAAEREGGGP